MLDRRQPDAPRRAGQWTLLAGAFVFSVAAIVLLVGALDWRASGCDCDESLYPERAWLVPLMLGIVSTGVVAILLRRALRRPDGPPADTD